MYFSNESARIEQAYIQHSTTTKEEQEEDTEKHAREEKEEARERDLT